MHHDSKTYPHGNYYVPMTLTFIFATLSSGRYIHLMFFLCPHSHPKACSYVFESDTQNTACLSRTSPSGLSSLVPEMNSKRFQLQSPGISLALLSSLRADSNVASYNHFSHIREIISEGGGGFNVMI